jgi:hypothetical protein
MEWVNGQLHWKPVFIREAQDWEIELLARFFDDLYAVQVTLTGGDKLVWLPSPETGFQVKSFYRVLQSRIVSSTPFPFKCIWKTRTSPRVTFFIWTAALGNILTASNLQRRAIIITDWCCICRANGESVNHLLLHCSIIREFCDFLLCLVGLTWVMPNSVIALLES